MFLDCKLNFEELLKTVFKKINKTIGLLYKLLNFLPRNLYLQYINPLSDQTLTMATLFTNSYYVSFHQRLETLQYNAALAITGTNCGTSKGKLYNKLGLESFQNR